MIRLASIVAATATNGIAKDGRLPWHIPEDLRYFAHVTQHAPPGTQNAIIMGRKTWESIPVAKRPLSKRFNIVLSRDRSYNLNVPAGTAVCVSSLEEALNFTPPIPINRRFIIGGASVYNKTLQPNPHIELDHVLVTRITAPFFDCDTFMPEFRAAGNWKQEPHSALVDWVGFSVPEGKQKRADGTEYEFQMWTHQE